MEFTYEGFVRYGFGFYNPNHAAAFICAILPFAWLAFLQKPCWQKILGGLISVILIFDYRSVCKYGVLDIIFRILYNVDKFSVGSKGFERTQQGIA